MSGSVSLEGVSKVYGATRALDDVTLRVEPGELVTLLGSSGCGKTTLLRCVAGLVAPDAGRVWLAGADVTAVPTQRRSIGMMFQHYALFPNMSVADNVGFPLRVRKDPAGAARARVAELLDMVGLAGYGSRYPNQLSGGQQQRVALARALAPEPSVLLLDEPLSALDAVIRSDLRDEIRRVQQRVGITALYVTHDQSEALAIADRVAVMSAGRIVEVARPADIYDRPASRFAATFVGSRNALEIPVSPDRTVRWGDAFTVSAPAEANGRALALFRPEDVELVERGGVEGTVDVTVFLGSVTRAHVRVGEQIITVDVRRADAEALSPGQPVRIAVRPDRVRVFAT